MSQDLSSYTDEDLEELEDKLLAEDEKEREEDMPVSGKSVFEIERQKRKREEEHRESKDPQ